MSILNLSGRFGLIGLIKGFGADVSRVGGGIPVMRSVDVPVRRQTRCLPPPSTVRREVERFEEDCERWDGLS